MAEVPDAKVLQEQLKASWAVYVDWLLPIRADLHAYCRRLTRDIWDAEDLIQDTLVRGFSHLGHLHHDEPQLRPPHTAGHLSQPILQPLIAISSSSLLVSFRRHRIIYHRKEDTLRLLGGRVSKGIIT